MCCLCCSAAAKWGEPSDCLQVDSRQEVAAGSPEEIEIRGCTIQARILPPLRPANCTTEHFILSSGHLDPFPWSVSDVPGMDHLLSC